MNSSDKLNAFFSETARNISMKFGRHIRNFFAFLINVLDTQSDLGLLHPCGFSLSYLTGWKRFWSWNACFSQKDSRISIKFGRWTGNCLVIRSTYHSALNKTHSLCLIPPTRGRAQNDEVEISMFAYWLETQVEFSVEWLCWWKPQTNNVHLPNFFEIFQPVSE